MAYAVCKHYQLKSIYDSLVGWQWSDHNYNGKHFFNEDNAQCNEHIICK